MKKLLVLSLLALMLAACTRQDRYTENTSKDTGSVKGNGAGTKDNGLSFETKTITKSYNNCTPGGDSCTYISIVYNLLTNGANKDKINSAIRDSTAKMIFVTEEAGSAPQLEDGAAEFISEYESFRKDAPDAPDIPWSSDTKAAPVFFNDKILSYSISTSSFTGGAHPNSYLQYYNFELSSGRILKPSDIFKEGFEAKLNEIIERKFREKNKLAAGESLTEGGLFENKINFNDNFAVIKDGILFYYNNYEIAPYAAGPTEIMMTYAELGDIIKEDMIK
jgi:hypothetical protein